MCVLAGGGGGVAKVSERGSASEQLNLTEQFNNAKPTPSTYAHSATDAIAHTHNV